MNRLVTRWSRDLRTPVVLVLATFLLVAILIILQKAVTGDPPTGWPASLRAFSWLRFLEFSIPSAVLVMEAYVIRLMRHESRERMRTLHEFRTMRENIDRSRYMLDIAAAIHAARDEIRFTSATMEASSRSDEQKAILESVKARKARRDYKHLGLIARTPSALPGAVELRMRTHIQIKMSDMVTTTRLRFFVADRRVSIIGVAEGSSDLADPKESNRSTRIESRMLGEALFARFSVLWGKADELGNYVDTVVANAEAKSREEVRSWYLSIPCTEMELDQCLAEISQRYRALPSDALDAQENGGGGDGSE